MNSIQFLIETVFGLYLMVVLLRIWLQFARADFYNPFSQFIVKATHPIVAPMRRVFPSIGKLDTASLVLAILVSAAKFFALALVLNYSSLGVVPLVVHSCLNVIREAFQLVIYVLVGRAILSWFSQGHNPVEMVLHQLTEPMLAPIRRVIPPIGGLDLSVMALIFLLLFLKKFIQDIIRYL